MAGVRMFAVWGVALGVLGYGAYLGVARAPGPKGVDERLKLEFTESVKPLMQNYCAGCHMGPRAMGGFRLSDFPTADAFTEKPKTLEKLIQYVRTKHMPPAGSDQPTVEERAQILTWAERVFAAHCGDADAGKVTLRRLSRFEYENTVADLLGVRLDFADEFPSDDVGYGFDNIGDVLTLSTLHLEKYLAAGERVAAEVFPAAVPSEYSVDLGRLTLPQGVGFESNGAVNLYTAATISAPITVKEGGEFLLSVRLSGMQAGPDPCQARVAVNGRVVSAFAVRAQAAEPVTSEFPVTISGAGTVTISVQFTNDYYNPQAPQGQRDRNLLVHDIKLRGPIGGSPKVTPGRRLLLTGLTGTGRETAVAALRRFAARAFRRPLQPGELDRIMGLYDAANRQGLGFEQSMQVALTGILVSPNFLFRVELDSGPRDGRGNVPVGDYELASRLSYFLWGSVPDDQLIAAAAGGALGTPEGLQKQVERMLVDPKSRRLADGFVEQWLQLRKLEAHQVDPTVFPEFTAELRASMVEEPKLLFLDALANGRKVSDLLDSRESFVNGPLARLYGISGVTGAEFRRVSLPPQRGGILGTAAYLTVTSNPNRTSPVKRGRFVLDNILGTPLPPPPPDVGAIAEDARSMAQLSLRERFEEHRKNPACATCHASMDPIGFGLENFDGIGQWRTMDGPHPIDASGQLPDGAAFTGPAELRTVLKTQEDLFVRHLGERLLTYATGRGMRVEDACHLDAIRDEARARGGTVKALVIAVVLSEPFRFRAGR